jgi:hypothetical protein
MTEWKTARLRHEAALREFVRGNPEPFKTLWSHGAGVSIFGGWGAYDSGWDAVGPRLDWAASRYADGAIDLENLHTWVDHDLACTVDLEHQLASLDGKPDQVSITLRSTHVYRREADGWRCVHRHADFMTPRQG